MKYTDTDIHKTKDFIEEIVNKLEENQSIKTSLNSRYGRVIKPMNNNISEIAKEHILRRLLTTNNMMIDSIRNNEIPNKDTYNYVYDIEKDRESILELYRSLYNYIETEKYLLDNLDSKECSNETVE